MVTGAVLLAGRRDRRDRAQAEAGGGTGLTPLRVGLIGYGLAGSAFHAPLVEAVPGLALASIVTSNAERAAQARSAHPDAAVLAVRRRAVRRCRTSTTSWSWPRRTASTCRSRWRAVDAGLHVVVDKPLAASAAEGERLAEAARAARGGGERVPQPPLGRRLPDAAAAGRRGRARRAGPARVALRALASRGGRRRSGARAATPEDAGGLLFDLGPHLIDQALELLGPARSVYAEVRPRAPGRGGGRRLLPRPGARARARARTCGRRWWPRQPGPRFRALGSRAAYVKWGLDVQEDGAARGRAPARPRLRRGAPRGVGLLGTDETREPVRDRAAAATWSSTSGSREAIRERRAAPRRAASRPASRRCA